jgi:hypothetical protein
VFDVISKIFDRFIMGLKEDIDIMWLIPILRTYRFTSKASLPWTRLPSDSLLTLDWLAK